MIETDSQGKSRITHIGTEDFAKLGIKARDAYMKHHRIIIGDARTKVQKEVRIIQHIQAGPLKAALSTNRCSVDTTSGAKVKPTWLLQTGTILRLINFITSEAGQGHYISLKGGLKATMLTTAIPHPEAYATILDLFNTPENQDDNIELVQQYDELPQIFDEMESSKYDELTREKLIELITYVDYWYGNASKAMKNVSGTHDANFRKYCKGKDWIFYFHLKMKEMDPSMINHVNPELPDNVRIQSTTQGQRSRSVSPVPPGTNSSKKVNSSIAVKGAADAIKERMDASSRSENIERLEQYEEKLESLKETKQQIDADFLNMKDERKRAHEEEEDYEREVEYQHMQNKCKAVKKKVKRVEAEIKMIKERLGYHNDASDDGSYDG